MQPYSTPAGRDPELWRLAKRRAKFKSHLFTYLSVNALLWAIWALTDHVHFTSRHGYDIPWPLWSTVFWGIGVLLQGLGAYGTLGKADLAEREYERLTRQR